MVGMKGQTIQVGGRKTEPRDVRTESEMKASGKPADAEKKKKKKND